MNFKKILDHVRENGGVSYSVVYGNLSGKKGYAVSIYKDREVILPYSELTEAEVRNFYYENAELLAQPEHFFGIWVDNGNAYLDVSVIVRLKADALKLAKEKNQLAIFDLNKLETVYV
jgi:hypothetical protein